MTVFHKLTIKADLDKMDLERMSTILHPLAEAFSALTGADDLPFALSIPATLQGSIRQYWEDCFGGWEGFAGRQVG